MPSVNAYGMITEPDASIPTACPKSRQRLAVIALSSIVLLSIITVSILATHFGSNSGPQDPNTTTAATATTLRSSIKAMCNGTLYPDSCYASLSPAVTNYSGLDPAALFRFSLQAAKEAISSASGFFDDPTVRAAVHDNFSADSISDCKQLLTLAATHIEDCFSSGDFTNESFIDDLKTWLSASITDLHTCLDGLDPKLNELKARVAITMKNSTELTSNSLALLRQIEDFVSPLKFRRRRLFGEHPPWMSSADRRRLTSSSDWSKKANAVVAKDGSGKYNTIAAALAKVPKNRSKRFVIYVKKGVYYENVRIETSMWNVMIVGDGMDATVVSGCLNFVDGTPTFSTATFAVFGKGFIAQDMGFQNAAGAAKQQAVALLAAADFAAFYHCKFEAYQDTLYAHSLRQFYRECNIYGTVDFIFGNAAVVFQSCNILPRAPLPGQQDTITAQGKIDPNQNTGISIHNCTIWPAEKLASPLVYLGRPWKPYSTTVFMRSMIASIVNPAGWLPWNGPGAPVPATIFYSEYSNFGPGSSTKKRVKWKGLRVMDSKQANHFTVRGLFGGSSWIPKTGIPFSSGL
ncbi:hypothetical protein HPP92_005797 [Vanilla planifolia]|uniref:Pectinesterase n=1 Tax=Vanilla planifolia TaxID=51239 RepID=A0A835V9E2_VANPL|nr:hypothetical protein HPP92_005797 [Vanilla planifolia]